MIASGTMASFGWLHFSDLHQGIDGHGWFWPNIQELLYADLARLHRLCGPWDVVFFTGDLTQAGKREEFKELRKKLSSLWKLFRDLGSRPVLLAVPGNHDLLRPRETNPTVRHLTSSWDVDQHVQNDFWGNDRSPYRTVVERAFANYASWRAYDPSGRPTVHAKGLLVGDFAATIRRKNAKLGILGLNTAFLQLTGADYKGKLAVSIAQAARACQGDLPAWAQAHDACLLLTHHPPCWLSENSKRALIGEIAPPGRFVAHLFGHVHDARIETRSDAGSPARRELQGASLFGVDGESRRHGYAAGRIELGPAAQLRIWPRISVQAPGGTWRIVPDHYSFALEDDQGTRESVSRSRLRSGVLEQGKVVKRRDSPRPRERVLVVEDDMAYWFEVELGRRYQVEVATSFAGASGRIAGGRRYDVAIVDLQLLSTLDPFNLDGVYVLEQLNKERTPCIVISQYLDDVDLTRALQQEFPWISDFIRKNELFPSLLQRRVKEARSHRPSSIFRSRRGKARKELFGRLKRKLREQRNPVVLQLDRVREVDRLIQAIAKTGLLRGQGGKRYLDALRNAKMLIQSGKVKEGLDHCKASLETLEPPAKAALRRIAHDEPSLAPLVSRLRPQV